VDTGGTFVATTQDLTNAAFMSGGTLTFSGTSTASVLNLGKVGSLGGDVALIASKVENDGTITAAQGDVGLAAGYQVTMADATQNEGRFQVKVGGLGTSATNTGTIQAAEAELKANGGNVYALAGNTGGIIQATGVSATDGKVLLIAEDGTTTANGTIQASGEVETSGESVNFDGLTVKAANWLVDPTNLTINAAAATTIDAALAADTNVILRTTSTTPLEAGVSGVGVRSSGAGDIIIASAIDWSTAAKLTLDAYHSIAIDAPIATAGGAVVLNTNYANAGGGGDYGFDLTAAGFQGSLSFAGGAGSLTVNGAAYTLISSMTQLAAIGSSGDYALATSLTATSTYAAAVVASFGGTFTGLGHTISGLTIFDTNANGNDGLFGTQSGGAIRDIGLLGGLIFGGNEAGVLAGAQLAGSIENAYATGPVYGDNDVGGLVGDQSGGATLTHVYATGAVSGVQRVGGLVGAADGAISGAYASGAVDANGNDAGGLVGFLNSAGVITDAAAFGPVAGATDVGGLVGFSNNAITDGFATGAVSGTQDLGGIVGYNNGGAITDSYWDMSTTGQAAGAGAGATAGLTGETTLQLQGALPTFANPAWSAGPGLYPYLTDFFPNGVQAISGIAYADSGVTPAASNSNLPQYVFLDVAGQQNQVTTGANGYYYLAMPAGTLSAGGTPVVAYMLEGDASGALDAATLIAAIGTTQHLDVWTGVLIAPTTSVSLSTAPTTAAALLAQNANADQTLLSQAAGTDTAPTSGASGLALVGYIATGAGGFNVDQGITGEGLYVMTTGGPITLGAAQILGGPINLSLFSSGALEFDASITANGAVALNLAYDASSPANLGFAPGVQIDYGASDHGGTLAIDGAAYTLVYSMAELAADLNGSTNDFALATSVTPVAGYTAAVVDTFGGTFTGLGNTITGLAIAGSVPVTLARPGGEAPRAAAPAGAVGLFGTLLPGGEIRDIGLVGGDISGDVGVGALAGKAEGLIVDAYSTATVSGTGDVGGLVGYASDGGLFFGDTTSGATVSGASGVGGLVGKNVGTIEGGSSSSDAVSGAKYVGGLVGANVGTITDASASGSVTGSGGDPVEIGGLAGYNSGNISGASAGTGSVSGGAYVGGLVGYNTATGTLSDDATSGATISGTSAVGGLVGENLGTVEDGASSSDAVSGTRYVGGLAGYNSGGITAASATGQVTGTGGAPRNLGGLVGDNTGNIDQSFATGAVTADADGSLLGGLAGYNADGAAITNTYATGQVGAGTYVGGLVGENAGSAATSWASGSVAAGATSGGVAGGGASTGVFTDVYWDTGTTGQASALGRGSLDASTHVVAIGGSTGRNPDSAATYAGFNFTSVWTIDPGASRPYLRAVSPQTPPN
jgi:hypothetical protein